MAESPNYVLVALTTTHAQMEIKQLGSSLSDAGEAGR